MAEPQTFMQALMEGARQAAESDAGQRELTGMNKEHFLRAVELMTGGLSDMPKEASLHVMLFAVTYIRNAIIFTMQENEKRMAVPEGEA